MNRFDRCFWLQDNPHVQVCLRLCGVAFPVPLRFLTHFCFISHFNLRSSPLQTRCVHAALCPPLLCQAKFQGIPAVQVIMGLKHIAAALGLSKHRVCQLGRKGMPTDSIPAAIEWRLKRTRGQNQRSIMQSKKTQSQRNASFPLSPSFTHYLPCSGGRIAL